MIYFAKVTSRLFLVEFPELAGCLTEETLDKALANAEDALNGWLASNCDRSLNIPEAKLRRVKNAAFHRQLLPSA